MPTADREISVCNFRDSGMLSNESTRYLRGLHEGLAKALSHSLDLFLGVPLEVKLVRMEQVGGRAFAERLTTDDYLVPLTLAPMPEQAIVSVGRGLLFRFLDLLLGGDGEVSDLERDITDIDEELFRCVLELVCGQLERTWKSCGASVAASRSIKQATLLKLFVAEERLLELRFAVQMDESSDELVIVVPATVANALAQRGEIEGGQKSATSVSGLPMEGRLMQARMRLSVDLCSHVVPLGELVAMQVGSILNLGAPADTPIHLRVDGHPIFEVTPVKHGRHKAAQMVNPLLAGEGV